MSFSVTNTFVANTNASASQVNTNFSDIVNALNSLDGGSSKWAALKSSGVLTVDGASTLTGAVAASSTLSVAGVATFTASSATSILAQASYSGGILGMFVDNQSNTASSDARVQLRVGGTSAGDPFALFSISGSTSWSVGLDNSDSDKFKISQASGLGTNDYLVIDASSGAVAIQGTSTNDDAGTGDVGEYTSATAADQLLPTSNDYGDVTSISLTAGDWDVYGFGTFQANGGTWSLVRLGISPNSGNSSANLTLGDTLIQADWANSSTTPLSNTLALPCVRVKLTSTTTYYLKMLGTYTAGSPKVSGRITARRRR